VRLLPRFAIALVCACGTRSTSSDPPASPPATAAPSSASADAARVLRDKIVGVNAHVIVLKDVPEFAEYRDVLSMVERREGVVAAEPFVFVEVLIASAGHAPTGVAVKGVDPQRVASVLDLAAHLKAGKIQDLAHGEPPALIIGDVLARALGVRIGDRVTMTFPQVDTQQMGQPAHEYPFRVTGTFHVGFEEYDERLAYTSLAAAQNLVDRGDQVMGIELKLKDIDRSAEVAQAIEHALGGKPYHVMDWYELNRNLFRTLFGERRP
jgi:lipoprotein-releasing system permease protein